MKNSILVISFLTTNLLYCQEILQVTGRIVDYNLLNLNNVKIENLNTGEITSSSENGNFGIKARQKDTISFFYLALKPEKIVITKDKSSIRLIMVEDSWVCFESDKYYIRQKRRLQKRMKKLYDKADKQSIWK